MASIKARGLAIAGLARRDERAVAFNTGTGRRSDMPAAERRLDVSRPIELTSP